MLSLWTNAIKEEVNHLSYHGLLNSLTVGREESRRGPIESRGEMPNSDFGSLQRLGVRLLGLRVRVFFFAFFAILLGLLPLSSLAGSRDTGRGAEPKSWRCESVVDSISQNSNRETVTGDLGDSVDNSKKLEWEKELAGTVDGSWRPVPNTGSPMLFEALRANAPHMIKWLEHKAKSNPIVTKLLGSDATGVVLGDFHILNVGLVELLNHSRKIGGIDDDDGGVGLNLFVDLFRGLVGIEVSQVGATAQEGFARYLHGFNDETDSGSHQKPKFISEIERLEGKDFDSLQEQWLKKLVKDGAFTEKAKLVKLHEAPKRVHELFELVRDDLEAALDGKKILDHGYRSKTTGGSQGLPRFWYLVENSEMKSGVEIIEFKFQGRPASDLWVAQPKQTERVAAIDRAYRPLKDLYGVFRVVETHGVSFLERTRYRNFFEFDFENIHDSGQEEELEKARQYYLYILEWLGSRHRMQVSQNAPNALGDSKAVSELFSLVQEYIEEMKTNQAEVQIADPTLKKTTQP